jgi:tetratricopeptide (TPR) repeat protein
MVGVAQPAFAEDRHQAMVLYDQGVVLYDHGDYLNAATRFEDAYKAASNPTFLYNIAQCYRMYSTTIVDLRDRISFLERAISNYQRYLREYQQTKGKQPPHEKEVAGFLDEELLAVAHLTQALATEQAQAKALTTTQANVSKPVETPAHRRWEMWVALASSVVALGACVALAVAYTTPRNASVPAGTSYTVQWNSK